MSQTPPSDFSRVRVKALEGLLWRNSDVFKKGTMSLSSIADLEFGKIASFFPSASYHITPN